MFCWNFQTYEGEYAPGEVTCGECGQDFDHKAETGDGGTYSHRCNNWVEIAPGKHAWCALPTHSGECIGEVVTHKPKLDYQQPAERKPVRVYTDGGYREGVGGWGWWEPVGRRSEFGSAAPTTNQRMELVAAFEAIDTFLDEPNLTIVSDSAYLINNMNEKWYERWKRNGWVTGKGQPIANKDLWEKLIWAVGKNPAVKFEKVKGHSGDPGNERADQLATKGIMDYLMSRRRIDELREMLHAHSYAYYMMNEVVITDHEWDEMARRLVELHVQYPHAIPQGYEAEYFKDFDGSTGFNMPWTDHIRQLAEKMVLMNQERRQEDAEAERRISGAQAMQDELDRRKKAKLEGENLV